MGKAAILWSLFTVFLILTKEKRQMAGGNTVPNFTASTVEVLKHLAREGPLCPKDISEETGVSLRTVSFALRELRQENLCRRIPNLQDMRKPLYLANKENLQQLQSRIDTWRALIRSRMKEV
ncbi:MAG: winged helix-turn-helix transcriptional regulator [Candidatus Lokiarchaeota archaeon]|jgi:DNA-binding MarR family transcriptional regulator|nr:winged helix-turn-helix transcriptional regulator [Candidatus Lokiarchaeota archaeon]